jgi:hypothetical protein
MISATVSDANALWGPRVGLRAVREAIDKKG